jgi:hypothetical protein
MMCKKNSLRRVWIMVVLLTGIFLVPALHAQPSEPAGQGRILFIFDTSLAMKSRVEAVQKALNAMLATSLHGQLHTGDSIGVWTFNQDLQTASFPLQSWSADDAVKIAASLTKFVGGQRYAKTARFEALQPLLNQVVQGSGRLTVLIFCDGTVKAAGTPFDAGINQAFQQKLADQSKAHEPFIILLRSQRGKFTGCTLSFPPAPLNIPDFPPLPAPPPAPKVTNLPPPKVTSVVPSLFITGTKVSTNPLPPETNLPPANAPAPPPAANPPAPPAVVPPLVVVPVQPTNATTAPPTNQVVAKIMTPAPINAPVPPPAPPATSGSGGNKFLMVAAGLLGTAVVLGIVVRLGSHRKDSSLITRSMNDRR